MGKTILILNDIIDLNRMLEESETGYKVHLHDRCGSQSVSIETLNNERTQISESVKKIITEYFNDKGMKLKFSDDNTEFVML